MSYFVYIHTTPNNKRYIGVTSRPVEMRWKYGKGYQRNRHFYNAIEKYGWDNIDHKVYEVNTKEEMFYLEKYLISYYQTNQKEYGYNKSTGGESGTSGIHLSEEQRRLISQRQKGRVYNGPKTRSESFKKKLSKFWTNMDPEMKEERIRKLVGGCNRANKERAKRVSVNGIIFNSKSEAATYIGKSIAWVNHVIKGDIKKTEYEINEVI